MKRAAKAAPMRARCYCTTIYQGQTQPTVPKTPSQPQGGAPPLCQQADCSGLCNAAVSDLRKFDRNLKVRYSCKDECADCETNLNAAFKKEGAGLDFADVLQQWYDSGGLETTNTAGEGMEDFIKKLAGIQDASKKAVKAAPIRATCYCTTTYQGQIQPTVPKTPSRPKGGAPPLCQQADCSGTCNAAVSDLRKYDRNLQVRYSCEDKAYTCADCETKLKAAFQKEGAGLDFADVLQKWYDSGGLETKNTAGEGMEDFIKKLAGIVAAAAAAKS